MSEARTRIPWSMLAWGLLGLSLVLRLVVAWTPFDPWQLERGPLVDDSFYFFQIARNIAWGAGPTHDGLVATSGFQPLWGFLLVPVWWLCGDDPILPIHVTLTIQAFLGVWTGVGILLLTRRGGGAFGAFFAVAIWSLSPTVLTHTMNGLETPLAVCLLVWTVWFYHGRMVASSPGPRAWSVLGVLLAGCFLARADLGIFVLCLAADALRRFGPGVVLRRAWPGALLAILLVAPWLAWCVSLGSLAPESGAAIRELSRLLSEIHGFTQHAYGSADFYAENVLQLLRWLLEEPLGPQPVLPVGYALHQALEHAPAATWLSLGVLVGGAVMLRSLGGDWADLLTGVPGYLMAWAGLTLLAYAVWVPGEWFYDRYVFGVLTLGVVAQGVLVGRVVERLPGWAARAWPAVAALGLAAVFAHQAIAQFGVYDRRNILGYYLLAEGLRDHPIDGPIGVPQSGVFGYFCDCDFVALDGKVDGLVARHLREGTLDVLLREHGVTRIVDHFPVMVDLILTRMQAPPDVVQRYAVRGRGRTVGLAVDLRWP